MSDLTTTISEIGFQSFGKIPRWNRDIVITEKIDGTNGQITITEDGQFLVGSRNKWLTGSGKLDNYGFWQWCQTNKEELMKLGVGSHFGEWWGSGIQRGYGLKNGEKYFSLFNVAKWSDDSVRPACCKVVPVLYQGPMSQMAIESSLIDLRLSGSEAVPGYDKPEGVVIFHTASNLLFKATCEDDEKPKSQA